MKKFRLLSLLLSVMMLLSFIGIVLVSADDPVETQPEVIVTDPVASEVVTDPTLPTGTEGTNPTGTGTTDPSGTGTTDTTEPDYSRPTEYDEPSTFSDYESPAPVYTPGDQDYDKQDWQNLSLDLSGSSKGPGSFADIKKDRSTGDRLNKLWIVLGILFWCLSVAAITFAILYRPQKQKSKAGTSSAVRRTTSSGSNPYDRRRGASGSQRKSSRTPSPKYERKYSDDYNDGF